MALCINLQKLSGGRVLFFPSRCICQLVFGNTNVVQQLQTRTNSSNMECRLAAIRSCMKCRLAAILSSVECRLAAIRSDME